MKSRRVLSLVVLAVVVALSSRSEATKGNLVITQSTTLTEDHYGSITLAADNILLDCDNHQIIYDSTVPWSYNCTTVAPMTCGIAVTSRQNAEIHKCNIQGGFGAGIYLDRTKWAWVDHANITSANYGLIAANGDHLRLEFVWATYNSSTGFWIRQVVDYVKATGLVAAHNGGTGVYVTYSTATGNLNLLQSTSTANGGSGILLNKIWGGTVDGNTVVQNGGDGINIANGQTMTFSNNYSSGNGSGCDAVQSGTYNSWSGNFFSVTCPTVPSPH